MKKKLLYGLLGAAGIATLGGSLCSCSDNYSPSPDADGTLLVKVGLDKEVVASRAAQQASQAASRATAMSVDAGDLSLKLVNENGEVKKSWEKASQFTEPVVVPVGKYTMQAYYGAPDQEGFESPYYYGESSLTVSESKVTTASVTAQLANSMVRVEMSDMFRTYFESYSVSLRSELGTEHPYSGTETRPLYLASGQVTTTIEVTKKDGTTATLEPKSFTAQPRHSYVLKFDVNGGEADNAFLVLTYDELCDVEDVEIDLSSAILNAPAPKIVADGFADGDSWTIMPGTKSEKNARVSITAQGGLDGVIVSTTSAWLQQQGWPAEIDLIGADASKIALLKSLGLKVAGIDNPGKMALVDFTEVLSNIQYIEGGNNTATFTVQARDKNTRVAEDPVSFSVETITTTLEVKSVGALLPGQTELELVIATNAASLDGLIAQTKNDRNTWDNATISSCEATATAGEFRVVVTVPATSDDIDLKLILGKLTKQLVVKHGESPYSLASVDGGAYGWQAVVDLTVNNANGARRRASRSAQAPESVSFEVSTDGKNWTAASFSKISDSRFLIGGLTAGTDYMVRAICDGSFSKALSFSTEKGSQLDNAGMEDWYSVTGDCKYNGTCYWTYDYPGTSDNTVWGTMNLLTTSNRKGTYQGCAYGNFSGTRGTTDVHGGSKAAVIETVGWGDNSAPVISGRMGNCRNVTAGQLYLGSYDANTQAAQYGIPYNARPKSVEFWYKYSAKNSADYGKAFVKVLDASGNVLAEGTLKIEATNGYQHHVFNLADSYTANLGVKAASIQLTFISSDNADCLKANKDNLSMPGMWNLSDGRYTGSSLYVDDIKLNF